MGMYNQDVPYIGPSFRSVDHCNGLLRERYLNRFRIQAIPIAVMSRLVNLQSKRGRGTSNHPVKRKPASVTLADEPIEKDSVASRTILQRRECGQQQNYIHDERQKYSSSTTLRRITWWIGKHQDRVKHLPLTNCSISSKCSPRLQRDFALGELHLPKMSPGDVHD